MKVSKKLMMAAFLFVGILFSILNGVVCFVDAGTKPIVRNYGLHDSDGGDRYGWMSDVKQMYEDFASKKSIVTNYNYFSKSDLFNGLKSADYLNIHTHGNGFGLICIDAQKKETILGVSDLSAYSSSIFSELKVAYLAACNSASSGNIALAVKNHGAECTIGYTKEVYTKQNYNTIGAYNLMFAVEGKSVRNSMAAAIKGTYEKYGNYGSVDSYKIYGNGDLKY